ncbi:hypothetical protein FZC84_22565 [Rossellomorea vietnamensis]|uniref:DUF6843 domain-containing protein n=1 Tax=Rossellomorea vietnamensis TaxID=218284 RepID=A0A5D4LXG6_9BACI|nr:hypothetical protein [Rossellomorea vietnamensis]TYR94444.1 hypothetical protein FZC84_22565 [Rossellomorea vietnamensis]
MGPKLKSALYSSLIISGGFFLLGLLEGAFLLAFIVLFYAAVGNFLYGIPVSLLSDFLTRKRGKSSFFIAGAIHILSGFITVIVIEGLAYFAVGSAALFFVLDEWRKSRGQVSGSRKVRVIKATYVILFTLIAFYGLVLYGEWTKEETNFTYLIPDGFEGSVVIFYNVPGEPVLENDGEHSLVQVRVETLPSLEGTEMEKYAWFRTSSANRSGVVTDLYYYVDDNGSRTKVDGHCIHHGSSGSFSGNGEEEIQYSTFQITTSQCGEEFLLNGSDLYGTQSQEIMKYWQDR